jgi:hypothetical protein
VYLLTHLHCLFGSVSDVNRFDGNSERVIIVKTQLSYFSAMSWQEQVTFRFVLDQHVMLDLYSASSLKQQFTRLSSH